MLKKVLAATRAQIAVRVIRTCAEPGISSVAVYSDADDQALHKRLAGEAVHLAGSAPRETYLDTTLLVDVAQRVGADSIHPGYGLLSENAAFARLIEESGLVFVGPAATAIRALANKVSARKIASAAGVAWVRASGRKIRPTSMRCPSAHCSSPFTPMATSPGVANGSRDTALTSPVHGTVRAVLLGAGDSAGRRRGYHDRTHDDGIAGRSGIRRDDRQSLG
jgi:acetyl-CoA/propionyl-CoA carboxylase biotin carboxyl carrier protein